jgi:hypothetical protein
LPHFFRIVLAVGRHSLARKRRKPPVALAAVVGPAAMFFAAGADVHPFAPEPAPKPVVANAAPAADAAVPCCVELVAAAPIGRSPAPILGEASTGPAHAELVSASRWRVVDRSLPVGKASEQGLQVKTILASRAISAEFPEIREIGGVRPDPLPWHPNGLALDVTIPEASSDEGIALGNQIVAFVLKNAKRFGTQDAIWRGVYYTPGGAQSGGYGHYDHVHVTTTGGGYPTGGEIYYR